jgi:hypothetical protein
MMKKSKTTISIGWTSDGGLLCYWDKGERDELRKTGCNSVLPLLHLLVFLSVHNYFFAVQCTSPFIFYRKVYFCDNFADLRRSS